MTDRKLVSPDKRNRVSLGDFGQHAYYYMTCDESTGEILLQPVIVKPLAEVLEAERRM